MSWAGPIFVQPLLLNFICVTVLSYLLAHFCLAVLPQLCLPANLLARHPSSQALDMTVLPSIPGTDPSQELPSATALCSALSDSWQPCGLKPARLLDPWDFPDRNTGVGCHFLLQGVFPTQGSNPCLLQLLYQQADSLPTWEGHPQCPWPFLISKWSRKCPLL